MLDVVRPYKFPFSSEKWYLNLLIVFVALFIPIVGPIVIMGYSYQQIERWHRRKDDSTYEDFKLTGDGLVSYLTRGCWPFFIQFLVQQCPLMPLMLAFNVYVLTQMRPGPQPHDANRLVMTYVVFYSAFLLLNVIISFIVMPMMLRSGLMQDFKAGFSLSFIGDFISRTWGPMLIAVLIQMFGMLLLLLAGTLACCVGIVFTMPLGMMAGFHFTWQLYEIYLQRGGTPVPLKDPPPPRETPPVAYA